MSEENVSRNEFRALRRTVVQMEINDIAAITAMRTRRALAANVELVRAVKRAKAAMRRGLTGERKADI